MIGAGMLMLLIALAGMWLSHKGKIERSRWFLRLSLLGVALPILANWCGWIFTEVGRQPWVVFGLLKTSAANSPDVSMFDVILTLTGYIVIFLVLISVGSWLMAREIKHGPEPDPEEGAAPEDRPNDLALAY